MRSELTDACIIFVKVNVVPLETKELAHPYPSPEGQQHKSPAPSLAVEIQFLAMLDDERGFIVNSVFFANLLKVFVLL